MEPPELGDTCGAADRGEITFVQVIKLFARFALDAPPDILGSSFPLLNRGRRDSRDRLPGFIFYIGEIADHQDLGVIRKAEILRPLPAARAIRRSAENIS